jgi:glycosyltransferase involved in cell wall biosynthesis
MKILFLSAWYPNRYDPMPGLFVKQHAEAVSSIHHVAALYVHACNIKDIEIEQEIINNVLTTVVYYPQRKWLPAKIFKYFKAYYTGFKRTTSHFGKPDLIHVNILTRCGVVGLLLKIFYKIPYVITEHWTRYLSVNNSYSGFTRKIITKLVVKKSNGIVTVSNDLKKAMQRHALSHSLFEVIPNSVDTSVFIPAANNINEKKIFTHISCFFDSAKNISGMITAVNLLSEERHDFEFHLVGEGPDYEDIVNLSNSLELTNRFVFFEGLKEGGDLVKAYQRSLFTVLFSNYENMPVVIAESFACGIPVIATRVGGIPEVVNKTNGILVESGNINELLNALNYMLDHYHSFDNVKIRNFAVNTFGKSQFVKAYDRFYNDSKNAKRR